MYIIVMQTLDRHFMLGHLRSKKGSSKCLKSTFAVLEARLKDEEENKTNTSKATFHKNLLLHYYC